MDLRTSFRLGLLSLAADLSSGALEPTIDIYSESSGLPAVGVPFAGLFAVVLF